MHKQSEQLLIEKCQKLEKELALKNRELEIEEALERIRSRSMAMHKSDELMEVIQLVYKQLVRLNIKIDSTNFCLNYKESDDFTIWTAIPGRPYPTEFHIPYFDHPWFIRFKEAKKKQIQFAAHNYSIEEKNRFWIHFFDHAPSVTEERKKYILGCPGLAMSQVYMNTISLLITNYEGIPFSDEENEVFKRIGKVFEQSYTRFLDLQKAETQTREAQIEAALEKIRSRSLAMLHSKELREVIQLVYEQLILLNIKLDSANFILDYNESEDMNIWTGVPGSPYPRLFQIPYLDHPMFNLISEAKQKQIHFIADSYGFEEKNVFYQHFFKHAPWVPEERQKYILNSPGLARSQVLMNNISLMILNYEGTPYSEADNNTIKRFAAAFQQTYTRFLDLQKAESQTREAEIEASLERVRAKAMAMHSSKDIESATAVVFNELSRLGIDMERCGITLMDETPVAELWSTPLSQESKEVVNVVTGFLDFRMHPMLEKSYKDWREKKDFSTYKLVGDEVKKYYSKLENQPEYKFPKVANYPDQQVLQSFYFKEGALFAFTVDELSVEAKEIIQKFTKVFAQTYTRFLDIQKAEAQARKAEIEASIERVRAKAMAMHSSKDIESATVIVFNELSRLGIDMERCGITLMDETPVAELWSTPLSQESKEVVNVVTGFLDFRMHPMLQQSYQDWREKKDSTIYKLVGDEVKKYYAKLENQPEYKFPKVANYPDQQILHFFYFKEGGIFAYTVDELSAEAKEIIQKFTKVFAQTYTRFLDIQKAEAQARKAEIEASIERVRAKAMAMHSSKDIESATAVVFNELSRLGIDMERCGITLMNKAPTAEIWSTPLSQDKKEVVEVITGYVDLGIHPILRQCYKDWREKKDLCTYKLIGEEVKKYYAKLEKQPEYKFPKVANYPDQQILNTFYFKEGVIFAYTVDELSAEAKEIIQKFTKVFAQTYTRFLDIQKAEAQAREATKQASLDRVRGEIASMRSAADLELITPLIFKELTILGVPFIRCGVFIIDEKQKLVNAYLSSPEGSSLGVLKLPYDASELIQGAVDAWRKGEVYMQHWNKEDFVQWIHVMMEQDQIQDSRTYQGAAVPPESLDLHFVPFTQGMLYVGAVSPLDEKGLELAQSLAKAFSIAYARYEDFVKLELAKADIEYTLSELKSTQAQLIQQEKLASLGQLTAGIAHEIKNPLNFVNNFSEVSMELIEEALEEIAQIEDNEHATESAEILSDIKSNLKKIHEHGTRANGIVTSMLQHSRGGSGKKEPTDLNALIKEYVNLSFHGMRAGKNSINVDIVLDLDPDLGMVSLIQEDFTRVIINLCNNAFDAMRGKKYEVQSLPAGKAGTKYQEGVYSGVKYLPKLKVITMLEKGRVRIAFEDNGPGIPEEIKDKILQPFFTTKQGTEGTGLGLSITHDIVKVHGGELTIESSMGNGSTFIIQLIK